MYVYVHIDLFRDLTNSLQISFPFLSMVCFHIFLSLHLLPYQYLYQSVSTEDIPAILCAKAHGANMNFRNSEDEGKSPMLVAVEQVCEYIVYSFMCLIILLLVHFAVFLSNSAIQCWLSSCIKMGQN